MEFRAMKNDAAIVARGTFVAAAWYATTAALLLAIATKLPSRASSRARDAVPQGFLERNLIAACPLIQRGKGGSAFARSGEARGDWP